MVMRLSSMIWVLPTGDTGDQVVLFEALRAGEQMV